MGTSTRPILLRGARVLDPAGDADLPPVADVLIEGDAVAGVGPNLIARDPGTAAAAGPAVVDLSGTVLVPGFVNAHYHSHDVLARGFFESTPNETWSLVARRIGQDRSLAEIRLRTLLGAVECLRNGITTVQDFANIAPLREDVVDTILDAYAEAGIRVIFSIAVQDRSPVDSIPWARMLVPPALQHVMGDRPADPEAQIAFVERQIDRVGDPAGQLIWALSPSAPQRCSRGLLEAVADLSRRRRLPVYTHVYETRLQRVLADERSGGSLVDDLEVAGLLNPQLTIAHGVWPTAAEIERIARSGAGVVLNLLSNLRLRSGLAPIGAYRRAGVPLSLGCDNVSCSDVQSPFQAMKLYCLLAALDDPLSDQPPAVEALRLATEGGARSTGRADRLGAIRPGMKADLVAIDLTDPAYLPLNSVARQLVFAETGRGVRHVWVDGRQVVRDGRSVGVDEDRLRAAVAELWPTVRRDLDRFRAEAAALDEAMNRIQARAAAIEVGGDRHLGRRPAGP